jgi:hypothetical protein
LSKSEFWKNNSFAGTFKFKNKLWKFLFFRMEKFLKRCGNIAEGTVRDLSHFLKS